MKTKITLVSIVAFMVIMVFCGLSFLTIRQADAVVNITSIATASDKTYQVNELSVDEMIYIDRPSIKFTSIPDSLLGATYIMTANDDKHFTDPIFLGFEKVGRFFSY